MVTKREDEVWACEVTAGGLVPIPPGVPDDSRIPAGYFELIGGPNDFEYLKFDGDGPIKILQPLSGTCAMLRYPRPIPPEGACFLVAIYNISGNNAFFDREEWVFDGLPHGSVPFGRLIDRETFLKDFLS